MGRALVAELTKLKRSTMPLWTLAAVFVAPSLSNVFATAQETEKIPWPDFFRLASMTMGQWYGVLLFGLVAAYVFGREYLEGVAPTMMTVPVRRESVVFAKMIVLAVWVLVLAVSALLAQAAWAWALGLQGFAWADLWSTAADVMTVALLVFLTLPVVALIAVAGRGVFAPMIFSAFGFSAGMVGGIAGWGEWLPWAMPTCVGGTFMGSVPGFKVAELTATSWIISVAVFLVGMLVLVMWVNRADSSEARTG